MDRENKREGATHRNPWVKPWLPFTVISLSLSLSLGLVPPLSQNGNFIEDPSFPLPPSKKSSSFTFTSFSAFSHTYFILFSWALHLMCVCILLFFFPPSTHTQLIECQFPIPPHAKCKGTDKNIGGAIQVVKSKLQKNWRKKILY